MSTACYVAGYVGKKAGTEEDDSFQIMTGKPGIGFQWLKDNYKDVLATNSCVIEGREYPVPPAYLRWCKERMENELQPVKDFRRQRFENMTPDEKWDKWRENRAKEVHYKQRVQRQKEKQKI